jgi:hypothetical protein
MSVWEKLSPAGLANWQSAHSRWAERDAREWAGSANNTSLADKLYRQGSTLIPNADRQHVSPLGGVAKPSGRGK